jgi:hypothetical protein
MEQDDSPSEAIIVAIQQQVRARLYRVTAHAEREREAHRITLGELEEAVLSARCHVIEHYPEDPRGASCLVLGCTGHDLPIHVVCGLSQPDMLVVITVYRPDPELWIDWKLRRE